jgi:hypothetical protein
MSMPYGLKKATNYYQRIEAWKDWRALFEEAKKRGLFDQAILLYPPDTAGWRTIDKQIGKLRKIIEELDL